MQPSTIQPAHILFIESFSGLGGAGLSYAFLRGDAGAGLGSEDDDESHPGYLLDSRSRLLAVPHADWEALVRAVDDAKKSVVADRAGGCWSSPTQMSCPSTTFYDLGSPGDAGSAKFSTTDHMVRSAAASLKMLHYGGGGNRPKEVDGLPHALKELISVTSKIHTAVRASVSDDDPATIFSPALRDAVASLCSARAHAAVPLPGDDDEL
ncbi:hypothetical protein MKEN_01448500 [Mycena kentingensis (nom. inval.)]|nr:hypothetical protein MKEN_01448500 [Mycena kentingensis (nom. inval.)]